MNVSEFREPFRHWQIQWCHHDWVENSDGLWAKVFAEVPGPEWTGWEASYDNDLECRKRTRREPLGPYCHGLFQSWNSAWAAAWLEELTGIDGLEADPTMHGGGIHVTDPGGYLAVHLDYARHPHFDLERRLNLVLFLNPAWFPEWGGAFLLCDQMGNVVKKIYPEPHAAVLWEAGDLAYHGTEQVTAVAPPRVTVAFYYLTPPRPNVTRKRALFIPKRA